MKSYIASFNKEEKMGHSMAYAVYIFQFLFYVISNMIMHTMLVYDIHIFVYYLRYAMDSNTYTFPC